MTPHKTSSEKKPTIPDRLVYGVLLCIEKLLGVLPCSWVWHMGCLLGAIAYHLPGKRRDIVQHNLSTVHTDASENEIKQLTKDVFRRSFGNLLCSLNTAQLSPGKIAKVLSLDGLDNLKNIEKGQGAILLLFHMGNWEILTKMHGLIPGGNPVGGMFRPLKNPLIDQHIRKQRESGGSQMFSRKKGLIMAQRFLKNGGLLGILCDQWAGGAGLRTELFGKESSVTPLPAILALKHQCPVIPVSLSTIAPGRWQLRFHEPLDLSPDLDKVSGTKELVKTMEQMMRRYSKDIFWLHDRWKIKPRR
ncbi:MAG: lysophospholipid acyltransferase family protein [Akkermansiaceae bacterium]